MLERNNSTVDLAKAYNPKEVEQRWYKLWEENHLFSARYNPNKKPFCIVIPPPNVTGILHMGHALNNTIQDILIRYHKMKQEETLWMPGTDHAGIATQNVVEKAIAKEGLRRQDLGREKFLERVWQWKEQYGSTIIRQLKTLGASCDWQRLRFTMDDEYSDAVKEVFVRLYNKGLIYQGNYIINWCPRCQTALADEEAPHQQIEGYLYYLRYPFVDNPEKFIVVATTRPETMLGDSAVAVNPSDKRYKSIIGKKLLLPLVNRTIKIIADQSIDKKFGTGAVKITPAHDPNDYIIAKKHKLDFNCVMNPDGRMNEQAGHFYNMDRFEARQVIVEELKKKGLLEKIEPYTISVGHCYRCHTIIEPYLSKQWFVKMRPLAEPAIKAVKDGKIKFYPARWKKVYLNWMENIQDWCISRQIWWGHRIPVYYCRACQSAEAERKPIDKEISNCPLIVSKEKPDSCPVCGSKDIFQEEDVLDTWFSSWLWPFATFGWPFSYQNEETKKKQQELRYFYPTSVLVTAQEIIFFWVARMIMAGFEFIKDIPFRDVYIHGTVRDIEGKKMSKSLGNIIDPLEIIAQYGADALRASLIMITAQGQDVYLSKERFEQGRNFANKIWNAARFCLLNFYLNDKEQISAYNKENLDIINRWILSRLNLTIKQVTKNLDVYRFNDALNKLYQFFWHEFCDWYLEMIKPDIKNTQNQKTLFCVLEQFLRLLHPFMPFITEEIWHKLNQSDKFLILEKWPQADEKFIDKKLDETMSTFFEVVAGIRTMRAEIGILPQTEIPLVIYAETKQQAMFFESLSLQLKRLAKIKDLKILLNYKHQDYTMTNIIKTIHVVIPLKGLVDVEKEKKKLEERINKVEKEIEQKKRMLENKDFIAKAPKEVVEKEKNRLNELQQIILKLKAVRNALN
ncbi:MAG: valine--tRNA ligase [Candidatus Omnitrophica bacterium]|nr:valine--tRNA ligase [Candidatus Omnitrophota bacterium]